jgi:CRISPR-associated endonuclease/helicase Cas3
MFLAAVCAQMQKSEIEGKAWIDDKRDSQGRESSRRVIHIKQQTIVGYAVHVSNLTEEHSLRLQEFGIGGRRRLGCGIFNPTVNASEPKERRS